MQAFLEQFGDLLLTATGETLYMVVASVVFCYLLGIPLGVLGYSTAPGSLAPHRNLYRVLDWFVNVVRSVPFLILIITLIPLARTIVGKGYGPEVVIFAMVIGATNLQIVTRVILPETLPSLLRGMAVASITIVGYTAMAGAVGGGGLGDVAIRYGYYRRENAVLFTTLVILIVLVQLIQWGFQKLVDHIDKSK